MLTNSVPVTAYRGAGRPEGNYYLERLVDQAARDMAIDPVELRRRNHIRPDEMPWKAPSGSVYDSGDFASLLDQALEASDYQGFSTRERESASRGLWRGIGIGQLHEQSQVKASAVVADERKVGQPGQDRSRDRQGEIEPFHGSGAAAQLGGGVGCQFG